MENLTTEQQRQAESSEGSALQGSREQETIELKITDFLGTSVTLRPKVELYTVYDFMGRNLPGLALELYEVDGESGALVPYATLTKCFGEFIGIPNSAYIDTNNCPFADQLLKQGIAEQTGFTKESGFCTYPLWVFKEEFLQKIGGENYQEYARVYKEYDPFGGFHDDEEPDTTEGGHTQEQTAEESEKGMAVRDEPENAGKPHPASKETSNKSHKRKEPER